MIDVRARNGSGAGSGLRTLLCGLGLLLALLTASCGSNVFTPGTPVVTLTTEPGRFTSYIVYLDQIYFTKQDGSISTIPVVTQRVDLANLPSVANLLSLAPIQVGTYVSATFELNYTNAYITVDFGGQAYQAPPIDPANSAAAGVLTVKVNFDPNHPLVINNPKSTPVALNIDLEASNIVSFTSSGSLQTTVKPFWTATTTPAFDKQLLARGLFVISDPKNNNFTMNMRPLHDQAGGAIGAMTVNVTDQTYYQINGTTYVGANGLAAMGSLQSAYANVPVTAFGPSTPGNPFGSLDTIKPSMTATAVYVGSSTESDGLEDQLTGTVGAVSSNTLTIMGAASIDRTGVYYGYQQNVAVSVGPSTIVSIDGQPNVTPSLSSISVGQKVRILGVLTGSDAAGNPTTMDATGTTYAGAQIRLQNTPLFGTLNSATPASLSLNLEFINGWEPTFLNFAGTGASGSGDATASQYSVATPSSDQSGTAAGTLLKIDGLPNAFGSGPPYFTASAITPASQLDSQLILEWTGTGSNSPFTAVNGSGLTVNLADAALTAQNGVAIIRTGPVTTVNLATQPPPNPTQLQIAYNTSNAAKPPLFGVGSVAAGESLFSDPTAFATQVQSVVNGSTPVLKLVATGQYDPTTGTFTATSISINSK